MNERKSRTQGTTIRYSEAFKVQVIREIEEGRYGGCRQASEHYGIKGTRTVAMWLVKYGKEHLGRKLIRVETTADRDEVKRLKQRVRELERALSDTTLDLRLEQEFLKLSCRQAGVQDVEAFKKKARGTLPMA